MSETVEKRGPGRPPLRPDMREKTSREAAAERAAEIMGHIGDLDEGEDKFALPLGGVPDGWSYEWKRRTVYNQEDPAYSVKLSRTGWEPVPTTRHPEMMPKGGNHPIIERDGMVLMQRPAVITEKVKEIERQKARAQVRAKEEQLNASPPGTFERGTDPRVRPVVKKSYEAMPIPED
jgi:hypothetical protein